MNKSSKYSMFSNINNKSSGFVMVVVLLFMVILMIVAVTSMRTTKDDVAIAGARYFRNQAFQLAQSSIFLNETCIAAKIPTACGLANVPDFDGNTPGWLNSSDSKIIARSGVDTWVSIWTGVTGDTPATDTSLTSASTARLPQYVIEKMALQDAQQGSLNPQALLTQIQPYRLTARETSPNDGATVILQRHYWILPN